jgi:hypothetical protein
MDVWGHSTRHMPEREIKFCTLNRSNPWTQSADTTRGITTVESQKAHSLPAPGNLHPMQDSEPRLVSQKASRLPAPGNKCLGGLGAASIDVATPPDRPPSVGQRYCSISQPVQPVATAADPPTPVTRLGTTRGANGVAPVATAADPPPRRPGGARSRPAPYPHGHGRTRVQPLRLETAPRALTLGVSVGHERR